MQHLDALNRMRTKFMYNLGIPEIAEREIPSFVYKIDLPPQVVQLNREEKLRDRKVDQVKAISKRRSFKTIAKKVKSTQSLLVKAFNTGPTPKSSELGLKAYTNKYITRSPPSSPPKTPSPSRKISRSPTRSPTKRVEESYRNTTYKKRGDAITFKPHLRAALYDQGCITCGRENLRVKYHGERHICLECRKRIKTYNGDKVTFFLDDQGDIAAKAKKVIRNTHGEVEKEITYDVDPGKLVLNVHNVGYKCYATISGPDELIILLSDNQADARHTYNEAERRSTITSKISLD